MPIAARSCITVFLSATAAASVGATPVELVSANAPAPASVSAPAIAGDGPAAAPITIDAAANAARSSVQAMATWMARGVDSWFGDRPFEDGGGVSDGRFSVSLFKREGDSADVDVRFNARFRLPNLEEGTYLFFGRDDRAEVLTDKPGALSQQDRLRAQSNAERSFFAGFGRSLTDTIDFRLGMRGGFKAYVQGRYRKQWELGPQGLAEFRQTLFWSTADRAGSTTAFSYEHLVSPVVAFRWLSSATITQESERFDWSSLFGAYRSFGDQRLLSLETLVNGQQGSAVVATDYGVQARWEQPVHADWLIGGVVVGRFWPRPNAQAERTSAWATGVSLKMRF